MSTHYEAKDYISVEAKPSPSSPDPLTAGATLQTDQSVDLQDQELQDRDPAASWHVAANLAESFQYAGMGLIYAYQTQRNFRIHVGIAVLAIGLGLCLHIDLAAMALISLTCGLVMAMELINTALESIVDLTVGQEFHDLAKIAKDCAAAAVLVTAIVAVIVAGFLLVPPAVAMLTKGI